MPPSIFRRRLDTRRRRILLPGGVVDPVEAVGSALAGWLRLANATSPGGLVSSIPEILSGTNAAVQSNDANKGTLGTSANGLPILISSDPTFYALPLTPALNSATQWGWACWLRRISGTGNQGIYGIDNIAGASARKALSYGITGGGTQVTTRVINAAQTEGRAGTAPNALVMSAWTFITVELDLLFGADETVRLVITRNCAIQSLTFGNFIGAPITLPAAMAQPTGSACFCATNTGGSGGFRGELGPNFWPLGGAMPGRTEGLLTPAGRAALMNFEAPS